ncbi:MAG: excinuclease ABC subunit UvrC [Nanoarchaeota archaeon]|nr:excinuclease ABC subunit UvrC [Nanoarchaeota archaeon]
MDQSKNLPNDPGCYLFRDKSKNIIYIGKAKNLKKRVGSYFSGKTLDPKTSVLVTQIADIDFIATENEIEALILENNLIKKHLPKYNINLKDGKRYAYLEVTGEEFPRILIARSSECSTPGGKLFGPFVSGTERNEIMEFLVRSLGIRTCRRLPRKACLRYPIGLCLAPCILPDVKDEYLSSISYAKDILSGKSKEALVRLKKDMSELSKKKDYESALKKRDVIIGIRRINEAQNMERNKAYDENAISYMVRDDKIYLLLFRIKKGILESKEEFIFSHDNAISNEEILEDFIIQYYSENPIPKEILIHSVISPSVGKFLSEKKGRPVKIVSPIKGDKKHLIDLAKKNLELVFFAQEKKLTELKEVLNLETIPDIIECFDISHISGTSMVGSMVRFRRGIEDKANYRRFKIRSVKGIDDTSAIAEVVRRRYSRLRDSGAKMPDLIIIDGGIGQLNSALSELEKLGLKIPIISIAKQFEDVYTPKSNVPLNIDKRSSALNLIQRARDEAHRFAISYNRLLRKKEMVNKR